MAVDVDFDLAAADSRTAVPARVLTTRAGAQFALAAGATLEIVEQPQAVPVPGAAPHALGLLPWHGTHIALVDPDGAFGLPCTGATARYALVLAFRGEDGAMEHGALALDRLPLLVMVSDSQACDAPAPWRPHAISCFRVDEDAIPVLPAEIFWRGLD